MSATYWRSPITITEKEWQSCPSIIKAWSIIHAVLTMPRLVHRALSTRTAKYSMLLLSDSCLVRGWMLPMTMNGPTNDLTRFFSCLASFNIRTSLRSFIFIETLVNDPKGRGVGIADWQHLQPQTLSLLEWNSPDRK